MNDFVKPLAITAVVIFTAAFGVAGVSTEITRLSMQLIPMGDHTNTNNMIMLWRLVQYAIVIAGLAFGVKAWSPMLKKGLGL